MRDRVFQPDQDVLAPGRLPVMRERSDASDVRAAMDLQRRAGNRSVAELVARSHVDPSRNPLAALTSAGRTPAPVATGGAAGGGGAVSVQREPCVDCPDAAKALAAAGPEAEVGPELGQTG
jgi:hypothetical protein